jgi:probable DNA repair protein
MLEQAPATRLAIVVPDLERRRDELQTCFAEHVGGKRVWSERGPSLRDIAPFGAALSLLELLSPRGGFTQLSRWLRSPFFGAGEAGGAARALELEIRLRRDVRVEDRFLTAYRRWGLRRELRDALPAEAAKLESALDRLPRRATPTGWAGIWQSCLRDLDWKAPTIGLAPEVAAAWDNAIAAFSALTPVVGELDFSQALTELDTIAGAQTVYRPPIMHGLHLLEGVARVGPGYAGAWIMGFTDQTWPEPPELNPLVPWSVRAAHAMPGARPELGLAGARFELARLRSRVAIARFSCPARVLDQPQTPNPEIDHWVSARDEPRLATVGAYAAARIGARAPERETDPAPPLRGRRIRGGAGTLDLQAACPIRAFCETRLGARPLERPAEGLAARLRGLLVHRALELLLEPAEPGPRGKRLVRSVDAAFLELTQAGSPIRNIELELERERVKRLLERFLALESERPPFLTVDLERRVEITLAGRTLRCRIDRIDRLDSGEQVLIDYKTGKRPGGGWFDERLTDAQLPLYAQQSPETTGAVVAVSFAEEKIEYRAAGSRADCVPGRQRGFQAAEWSEQISRWRAQLSLLVDEYAQGDVRLGVRSADLADGAYAPLTRVKSRLP